MTSEVKADPHRRFQIALERARAGWAAADPAVSAALAGCSSTPEGIVVPFFGRPHLVTHPAGDVLSLPPGSGGSLPGVNAKAAHPSVAIVLLHYLTTADGTRPSDRWVSFRELPDGLFYAQAFAGHAEAVLAEKYGSAPDRFRQRCEQLGGSPLDLADGSYRFQALPRLAMATLLWAGDEEFPAQARILFDASAGRYLPTEDLSGIGDWLAHRLMRESG